MKIRSSVIGISCFFSICLFADDYVFVTAEKLDSSQWGNAHATSVLRPADDSQNSLNDILSSVPGVYATGAQNPRAVNNIFLRGSESHHTLVLIDGLEISDPSTPKRTIDTANTSLGGIERAEILRGGQSVLFGSNAVGGVINLLTDSSEKQGKTLSAGYGNAKEHLLRYKQQTKVGNWKYYGMLEKKGDQGISDAADSSKTNDRDGYSLLTFHGGVKGELTSNQHLEFAARYEDSKKDTDAGAASDDPRGKSKSQNLYTRLGHSYFFETLPLELNSSFAFTDHKRQIVSSTLSESKYQGGFSKLGFQGNYFWDKKNASTLGLEGKREEDRSPSVNRKKSQLETKGLWMNHHFEISKFFISTGLRYEEDDISPDRTTYRVAPGVRLPFWDLTLRGAASTSFIAPTLSMLYDSTYGNESMKAEKSKQWEIGLAHPYATLNYFQTRITDRFSYDPVTYVNLNAGKAEINGVEGEAHTDKVKGFSLKTSATRLYTKDLTTGKELTRRPRFTSAVTLDHEYYLFKSAVEFRYVGTRDDVKAGSLTSEKMRMASYHLINLSLAWKKKELALWGKLTNLLDRHYQEFDGYNTPGRQLMAGLDWNF